MRKLLFTLVILGLAACGGASREQHLARAQGYIAESDFQAATVELQSALQLDTQSAEVRWLLGKVYLETGNSTLAQYELQQAQVLGWAKDDVRPAMAQTLLDQGRIREVLALDYQDLDVAAAALLLSTQALAALSVNQVDKAQALLALALGKAPQLLQAKLAAATLVVHQGDLDAALTLLDAILAATPQSSKAWGLKGRVLAQQGKLEEARGALDQAIVRSSMAFPERLARALISLQLQDYAAAQVDAKTLLEQSPKDPAANYIQGQLHIQRKEYRKAITALTLAEPAAAQFPQLLYSLSMGYLIEKDLKLAAKYGNLFVKISPNDSRGRQLLAAIMLLQNKVKGARDTLQPVLDRDPDNVQALNIMANALLLDNRADVGYDLYARIAQLQPDWQFAPLRREAELVTGEEDSVVAATSPDETANIPQDDLLQILTLLGNKDFQGAIEKAKSYQYRDLDSLAPYAVLGRVYVAAGQPAEAKEVFNRALKRDPANPAANQGLALLALAAQDPDSARSYYQAILESYEDDLTTLLQLAALESSQNNSAAMVAALKQALSAHRYALEPRLRLASYYLSAGRPEKVEPLLAKLTVLQQQSPRVLELTAMAQLAQQQFAAALVSLQQLVNAKPDVANFHYLLATVARETGNQQTAKQELLAVLERAPQHVPALVSLARIAHSEGAQSLFEQYLTTLVQLAPDAPDVLRLRARAESAKANHVTALLLAHRAFELTPTAQTVQELAAYQIAVGNTAAARTTVQRWLAQHPTDVDARLDVAIAPDQPNLLGTLVAIDHLAGNHADVQHAAAGSPGDLTLRFHQAMMASALGNTTQAIATLRALVVANRDPFPERAEAEKLLATLTD